MINNDKEEAKKESLLKKSGFTITVLKNKNYLFHTNNISCKILLVQIFMVKFKKKFNLQVLF